MNWPVLQTDRLTLRHWRDDDAAAFVRFFSHEESARFVGGTCDAETAWRRMAEQVGHWVLRGHGYWAVETRASSQLVGSVGLWNSPEWPELELGYWLLPEAAGRGYASEAAQAARDHAFGEMGATTLVSYIDARNLASVRVAERLGARRDGRIELASFGPHDVYRYKRPR